MADAVVVDTDVFSYVYKGDTRAERYWRHLHGKALVLSFMSLAEVYRWAEKYRWGERRRAELEQRIGEYVLHGFSQDLCREYARVRTVAESAGRRLECADAWVAATATFLGIPLVTHNGSHYAGVPGLTVLCEAD